MYVLMYCVKLTFSQIPGTLVVLLHDDADEDAGLINSLKHRADILLSVDGLDTGVSRDIHGVVSYFFIIRNLFPAMVLKQIDIVNDSCYQKN